MANHNLFRRQKKGVTKTRNSLILNVRLQGFEPWTP